MKNIGIIIADDGEYTPLTQKIENSTDIGFFGRPCHVFEIGKITVYAVLCGIGKVNAAAAAMFLYSKGCSAILNYGYSGGISKVRKGSIVVSSSFMEHDFDLTCLGYKPCEKPWQTYIYEADKTLKEMLLKIFPYAVTGLAVTGDCFINNNELRDKMKNDFGAVSCDMETAAIASVCYQTGIPFCSVRQISDDAGNDASNSYKDIANSGNIAPLDGILTLIKEISKKEKI